MPKSLFPAASPERGAQLESDPTLKLLNDYDWTANPLGPIPAWPESLRGAVRVMMISTTPMAMMIGEAGILVYNNAYADFAGARHPKIFGMPASEAWPEVTEFIQEKMAAGLLGESQILHDQELVLDRFGQPESVWMNLHYSPVLDEAGEPIGTLTIVHETTDRVMAERALARSEERLSLALSGTSLVGTWDWDVPNDLVTADDRFAELYNLDPLRAGLGVPLNDFTQAIHPDDRVRVREEITASLERAEPFRSQYRLVGEDGQIRWVVASGRPRTDGAGVVQRFPGVVIDITEQRRVTEALAESELRFRTLADTMPQMVWSTTADGAHDYYNARWYEFTGVPVGSTDGEGWNGMFHPEDQDRASAVWQHCLDTGEPYNIEYRLRHHSGEYRWTLGRALPVHDESGAIIRWFGTCTDIHETKVAAEERELIAQELSHRIKNIFAVLTGIIGLSARNRPETKPFADDLRQRIYALGEAHDFVRPHSNVSRPPENQGSLKALIARLLRAYDNDDARDRLEYHGDDAEIDDAAATPLALLFHELGTNAAKYGALSKAEGRVVLTGRLADSRFHLTWKEMDGPAVAEGVGGDGFGTRLVALSVEGQLRGKLERFWEADGLRLEIDLPIVNLRRSARLRQIADQAQL